MPSTVLVLGAGASVAEALAHRPSRQRDHPPLDLNFFIRAKHHSAQTHLNRVIRRARELGFPDLCGTPPVSLEQYLGRLYFEVNNEKNQLNLRSYFELINLYKFELITTTNWMINRSGPLRRLLRSEMQNADEIAIVTFNHDLLAENAIASLPGRLQGPWCLKHSYGLSDDVQSCSTPTETFNFECSEDATPHLRIHKLHGSVNWVFRTRDEYPRASFINDTDRVLFVWNNRRLPEDPGVSRLAGGRRNWYLWPMIVPPIYEKHGLIKNELARVWSRAADDMLACDRVVFWGYSFPRADLHARYFFQGLAQNNAAMRRPVLINPDPGSHAELCQVLQPERVLHYMDVNAYLKQPA